MRPIKPINSGAHRSGTAGSQGKSRYFAANLPAPLERVEPALGEAHRAASGQEPHGKYQGRASVGPTARDEEPAAFDVSVAPTDQQWADPLDEDEVDLTHITIDLRETMIESPAETYYQRHSSRVPGHQ